jgi:hypothetical protein
LEIAAAAEQDLEELRPEPGAGVGGAGGHLSHRKGGNVAPEAAVAVSRLLEMRTGRFSAGGRFSVWGRICGGRGGRGVPGWQVCVRAGVRVVGERFGCGRRSVAAKFAAAGVLRAGGSVVKGKCALGPFLSVLVI